MGYDASAQAIIGIRIDSKKFDKLLYTKGTERACQHKTDETKKFCSECGIATWKKAYTPIPEFDEGNDKLYNFELHFTDSCNPEYIVFKKIEIAAGDDPDMFTMTEVISAHEAMKRRLEGTPFWNEKNFGIWILLYESC